MNDVVIWFAIAVCISQSATFSGLNLAIFSISRLRLEAAAGAGDADARRVLELRRNANVTLVTILLGNVAINVLLTLLAESVMAGVMAFLFSTVVITIVGEIVPQAYFSRHAIRVAALLYPVLRIYSFLLAPFARPVGALLDRWVGPEGIPWFREEELREVLRDHAESRESEVGHLEATGAINFLALDDLPVGDEGELLDPRSVLTLPSRDGKPVLPHFEPSPDDPFLRRIDASGKKWCVVTDEDGEPVAVLNAHRFVRGALLLPDFDPQRTIHHPLVVRNPSLPLGRVLNRLTVEAEHPGDDVVDEDLVLLWSAGERRIISGSDLLGRLLRGIVRRDDHPAPATGQEGRKGPEPSNPHIA